jgi:hypothetical protein
MTEWQSKEFEIFECGGTLTHTLLPRKRAGSPQSPTNVLQVLSGIQSVAKEEEEVSTEENTWSNEESDKKKDAPNMLLPNNVTQAII